MTKKVLFTGYYFDAFHGSMMHICEIGQYLKSIEYEVSIASVIIRPKIKKYVEDLGLNLYSADNLPLHSKYDIVWSYHFPLLPYLLNRGLKYDKIILGCLSGKLITLETPNLLYNNKSLPIYVNAQETKDNFLKKYAKQFPNLKSRVKVLPNLVPVNFSQYTKENISKTPKKIAVVSNHLAPEIKDFIVLFEKHGGTVDVYGEGNNVEITPEILLSHDVIITIGKTVQYALALGIPVYNYDIFGGNGYITSHNIDNEEYYNFSGRSNERKLSAQDIMSEILGDYSAVVANLPKLKKIALSRYSLADNIDKILKNVFEKKQPKKQYCQDELYFTHYNCLIKQILDYDRALIASTNSNYEQTLSSTTNFYEQKIWKLRRKYKLYKKKLTIVSIIFAVYAVCSLILLGF